MPRIHGKEPWNTVEERLRHLMAAGLAGEEARYLSFLKESSAYLRGYFRKRLVWFPAEVEDLVQETLLAIHNQRHTYDVKLPLTAWIHAIAKYKFVDFVRARGRRCALSIPLDEESDIFAVKDSDAMEARIDIEKLLEQLPDRHRLPILHVKLQGFSIAEAARLAGMSESAVKIGIHRGLKTLAAKMKGKA